MTGKRLSDVCVLGGAVVLSVGAGMVYVPAGLIVAGVCLLAGGLWLIDVGGDS